ncbi:hypothetical protein [Parasitella parasitica]|uniref:Uncharacterized protein n=1 Tax=Parasitella parasitica TaxID=35722 RepID=A0A0B7NER6_9FUNG|nr:hypothetical protein [Parasitella parasitica]
MRDSRTIWAKQLKLAQAKSNVDTHKHLFGLCCSTVSRFPTNVCGIYGNPVDKHAETIQQNDAADDQQIDRPSSTSYIQQNQTCLPVQRNAIFASWLNPFSFKRAQSWEVVACYMALSSGLSIWKKLNETQAFTALYILLHKEHEEIGCQSLVATKHPILNKAELIHVIYRVPKQTASSRGSDSFLSCPGITILLSVHFKKLGKFVKLLRKISAYYNTDNWLIKLNFKSYIKKQKAIHEIAKRLFHESNKYNKDSSIGEKKQTFTTEKWIPSPPKDKATDPSIKTRIIAYGNVSFGTSMKGKLPAPTKLITEAVEKSSKDSKGTYFIYSMLMNI